VSREPSAEITTILFTDLVSSTGLVQRVGDEVAQRVFEAHHRLLGELVANHGGEELQWLGDGLMAAFPSTADAVRCAVSMQRGVRQAGASHRLAIRVGLNVGEILRQQTGSGYFGTPVVVARRLCDRAETGEILCSATVAALLAGRKAFRFEEIGALELKGIEAPVAACRVLYQTDAAGSALERTPFVGRGAEIARLSRRLERAAAGEGGLALVVGEPGIGKTRLTEEFAEQAQRSGTRVLWGRCFEGDWAPPYAPFSEALSEYAKQSDPEALRKELGNSGGVLAALAPQIRERVPDLPQPEPLQPDEERYRLFDAVVQLLLAIAQSAPTVLVLDDLHWADGGGTQRASRRASGCCWSAPTGTSSSTASTRWRTRWSRCAVSRDTNASC
jgi:class 3 adenylate cyclase